MKRILLTAAIAAASLAATAASPKNGQWVGDLFYDIDTAAKTAAVVSSAYYSPTMELYSGDVVVPATFTFNGETYTVTAIEEYAFCDYNDELTSVELPNTIITIGTGAFDGTCIEQLVVPNSVKTIGTGAFQYSELKSITLGSGVETIGQAAFVNCSSLTSITTLANVPPAVADGAFNKTDKSNITLTVPFGTTDTYKAAPNWDGFKAYAEAEKGPGVGVEAIEAASEDTARFFNMQGMEIAEPAKGQIVIEVRGGKSTKRVIR